MGGLEDSQERELQLRTEQKREQLAGKLVGWAAVKVPWRLGLQIDATTTFVVNQKNPQRRLLARISPGPLSHFVNVGSEPKPMNECRKVD